MPDYSYDDAKRAGCACDSCPLRYEGRGPVPSEGPATAIMALIGEAPGRSECQAGRPFIGPSGAMLDMMLEEAGLRRQDLLITNTIICLAPDDLQRYRAKVRLDNAKEKKAAKAEGRMFEPVLDPVVACRPRLLRELERVARNAVSRKLRPVFVPTGNAALEAISGRKLSITRWRGSGIHAVLETAKAVEVAMRTTPAARLGRKAVT